MANKHFTVELNGCGFVDPQQQLGMALAEGDIRSFRLALDMGAEPELQDDKHTSVYEKALKTHGCVDFVEECLYRGCNPNYINQHLNKAAINFAADSRDPQIISVLLKYKNVQVDRKYAHLTPLNSLAKNITADNVSDATASMRELLSYGASVNIPDQREMTPLHYVLKNRKIDEQKKRELVKMFLELSQEIDIDSYREGEVRKILQEEYPDLALPQKLSSTNDINISSLMTHIRSGDVEKFIQLYKDYQLSEKEQHSQEQPISLLIESIKSCMHEAFDVILQSGIDINQLHNGNSAIEIAAIWGNWLALQKLLSQQNLKIRAQDQLLITVIKKLDEFPPNEGCDFNKCFYVLLDSDRVDVNEADASDSTPLHYAVKYRNRKAIQALLKRGAYIGMKSKFSDLPIDDMHPELLEEHFDRCISSNELKPGDQNFEIIMNYMNLMPKASTSTKNSYNEQFHDEMTPLAFIAESKEHRHLLQHPLITSFLFLKWHRLSAIFYINFLLYTFFAVSIITYTILKYHENEHEFASTLFGIFSSIGIIYLLVRETIQFIMSPLMYFRSPINYMEIALIVLSIITCYDNAMQRVIDPPYGHAVAVFTILLVAMEFCLLIGSLPVLSISTHMLMLRAVSTSFIKCFTLYSIFVITFSLCFYILFGKPESGSTNGDSETNMFSNPFTAVIKTIVMLTGEFDADGIGFNSSYSYLIFLLFVFFMSIVLFNLLNGLAVSDTQVIKAQAELNGSICRTNVLARYEEVLTGRSGRANFIVNQEPFRSIFRRLFNVYPNYIAGRQISILPNDGNKVMIPIEKTYEMTAVLKRGDGSRNSKTTFLPQGDGTDNEQQKKILDPPVRALSCCFSCISGRCAEMDTRTVKLALGVLEQKSATQRDKQRLRITENRLQCIEQKLENIFELLQDMQKK